MGDWRAILRQKGSDPYGTNGKDECLGLVYALRAKLDRGTMQVGDRTVPLTPGMAVTLEVKTGTVRHNYISAYLAKDRE